MLPLNGIATGIAGFDLAKPREVLRLWSPDSRPQNSADVALAHRPDDLDAAISSVSSAHSLSATSLMRCRMPTNLRGSFSFRASSTTSLKVTFWDLTLRAGVFVHCTDARQSIIHFW
jgi:hypothetical protein